MTLYDSILPCFGSRFSVVMMPQARRYRVFPLGTFHYFDWQKSDQVGISISTCPQIVSSETAKIGVKYDGIERILPFAEGEVFSDVKQSITPLKTIFDVTDEALPVTGTFTFQSAFYPQNFEYSTAPGYMLEVVLQNPTQEFISAEVFFELPLAGSKVIDGTIHSVMPIDFPDGIDHSQIDGLTFEQVIGATNAVAVDDGGHSRFQGSVSLLPNENCVVRFFHAGYIPQPTLNQQGNLLKFGYTTLWGNAGDVVDWWQSNRREITRKGQLFESTVMDATVPTELKLILSSSFKGLASNAWWAENDWFSVMEIGAYHSTLDVDFQLALFFFQYWDELIERMLNQWASYYRPGSGFMAHDVGQHLETTGNRYGGPDSAMKVEENCNYLILLHHYWRMTGDSSVLDDKRKLIVELVDFLIASDTTGSGLPNDNADNTNDWGSGLITASEEQSYHGVRLVAAYTGVMQIAAYFQDDGLAGRCNEQIDLIQSTMQAGWLGDHFPISFADTTSFEHYSMWTTHGLLYALRNGMELGLDMDQLRMDLISSTQRTMREHGSIHSTVDVRGWLTQNLWRDSIAAYLGVDMTNNLRRYMGHGEYVSYEDTTILEVANELMVVPGATAEHSYAGETHDYPMIDGHPRPACGFGLLYALGGIQFDKINQQLAFNPVSFPLRIALTHLADWQGEKVPWVTFKRSIPNQDTGHQPATITYETENNQLLSGLKIILNA